MNYKWLTIKRNSRKYIEFTETNVFNMNFYNTFSTQFELLPRLTIIYGKGQSDEETEITHNGIAIEWLWFGVFFNVC